MDIVKGAYMTIFTVVVTAYIPYAVTREYTEKATSYNAAVSRAIRKYRKDERVHRRRFDNLTIKVGRGIYNKPTFTA